jgi:acyl-CoA synthetase (AMP-forming)/AMP-acid ligase II
VAGRLSARAAVGPTVRVVKELVYGRLLLAAANRFADRIGYHDGAYHGTFGEHLERVLRLSSTFGTELGLGRSDRFAVVAGNGHEYLELYHAGFLGAAIVNPLNLRLSAAELTFILRDSGTTTVFVDALFAELIDSVRKDAGITHVVLIGEGDVPHDARYEDLLESGEPVGPPSEPDETDPVILMYTGGTTGQPKGVLLEQRAEMLNLYHAAMAIGLDEDRVYLHQTPMFHAASMTGVLGIPVSGGVSVFVPYFNPAAVLDAIERSRVNITLMVPVMVEMLLAAPEFAPERIATLETLVYGASPMPRGLLEHLLAAFPRLDLYQGYGMTEAAAALTLLTAKDHRLGGDALRSAGRPLYGVELTIRGEDGRELPVGRSGEICARAGNFMREYWKRPEETAEAFRDGWYHSGDTGYVDEQGFLFIVDRLKDMIVTGGENVYSIEVENAISTHPAVAQVAVIGIPHKLWGEAVHAVVVLQPGADATAEELVAHARTTIAGYKLPKSIEFRTEPLPLSGALKPLKRELRKPYWEGSEPAGDER